MTLPGALAVVVLLEGFAAVTLVAAAARFRLAADHRLGVEAELAVHSALALGRVSQGAALAGIPPGSAAVALPAPLMAGWEVTLVASREAAESPVRLTAQVLRRGPDGAPRAARSATLLLAPLSADTANVITQREWF